VCLCDSPGNLGSGGRESVTCLAVVVLIVVCLYRAVNFEAGAASQEVERTLTSKMLTIKKRNIHLILDIMNRLWFIKISLMEN
ncbi:MAG TPA: hypothetical protein VJB13_04185, partial [Candidatus Nanoarchaeia archaeon]|nr:hypothetical protein [Candidatus Nanoarchaeia archaeon]